MTIPFLNLDPTHQLIRTEIMHSFEEVYDSNWFVLGSKVEKFEKEYAFFNSTHYAIGVSNGLDALHLGLIALGIGKGDEVIVPSNTYIASALAVSHVGATPVFVEPDIHTYTLDPQKTEAAITSKTKAIMPVHLYGQACNMEALMSLAKKHKLFVIEDNAQAHGAMFKGQITGSFGDINATSFYPGKNLGALGDGGALTTSDAALAEKTRLLRNYGSHKKYEHQIIGFNKRLDEVQAAFLSVKLRYLKEWTFQRQQIAVRYDQALKGVRDLVLPAVHENATHVYHLYVIRTKSRAALQEYLAGKGIGTLIHYPIPPHLQEAYQFLGYKKGDFPIAEELAETCLSIPLWPGMTEEQCTFVCDAIKNYYN